MLELALPALIDQSGLTDCIDIVSEGQCHHIRLQTVDYRTALLALNPVRLLKCYLLALFFLPMRRECFIVLVI